MIQYLLISIMKILFFTQVEYKKIVNNVKKSLIAVGFFSDIKLMNCNKLNEINNIRVILLAGLLKFGFSYKLKNLTTRIRKNDKRTKPLLPKKMKFIKTGEEGYVIKINKIKDSRYIIS